MLYLLLSLFFILMLSMKSTASPPNLRNHQRLLSYNRIINSNTTCDSKSFNITLLLEQPFKGVLFAKEFSQDCKATGIFSRAVSLNLPTSGCGVSLIEEQQSGKMYYLVTVILQQDKYLRQISDEEKRIKCYVTNDVFRVKPRSDDISQNMIDTNRRRKGRIGSEWKKEKTDHLQPTDNTLLDALSAARAWMEIVPIKDPKNSGMLKVGEPALLIVKSTLPVGIGWKVVDCVAHDGLGDSSQKLLDENGCPIDELLLPSLFKRQARPIALMKHQEAVSKFAAFKFPDRDRLHLSCTLELCKSTCLEIDCSKRLNSTSAENRLARTLEENYKENILDKLEVFNSVEVRAPEIEIEDDYVDSENTFDKFSSPFGYIPGDKTFCVSPSNMALSFCLLGLVFLFAVFLAAWSLLRVRRDGANIPYYTRSLFSSSGGSGYGSKLLLQESPCMNHTRNIHTYGRMY